MNILRFLREYKWSVVLIVLLLFVQAFCELYLPKHTGDLIDIGLQQKGIQYAAPDSIQEETLSKISSLMDEDDFNLVKSAYSEADANGICYLKEDVDIESISKLLLLPESALFKSDREGVSSQQALDELHVYENVSDSYLNQIAVSFVAKEYEAQGIDLTIGQNRYLRYVGGRMLQIALFMMITVLAVGFISSRVSARMSMTIRKKIYEKVINYTTTQMDSFSTASLITRSTNDVQQVQTVVLMILKTVSYAPILAVFGIIQIVEARSGLGWTIMLAIVLVTMCVVTLIRIALPRFKKTQIAIDKVNLISREILTGILPIRAFGREDYEESRFQKANQELFTNQLFTNRTMAFMMPVMTLIMNGVSILIVWKGADKVTKGIIQVGDITILITYATIIVMSYLILSSVSIILPRALISANRIAEILDSKGDLYDPDDPMPVTDMKGEIAFEHVCFKYPGAEDNVLTDIDFVAKPGQVTAIIGSTGCGKTTLINLIPRLFDVTKGRITIDGTDIRNFLQKDLHSCIGYAPQKGILFSGTIRSNICYGGDDISQEDMIAAARCAQAEEFIMGKEGKYDAIVAQGGSNLSGGQRQRISIARAIAKKPKIYIFDDTFSALDYKTDKKIREDLKNVTSKSTVIIVAQRISTIMNADNILCIEDGRIVGQGTHRHLLRSCKTYLEIAKSQLSEDEIAGKVVDDE